jgi:uncharacterized membrane protein
MGGWRTRVATMAPWCVSSVAAKIKGVPAAAAAAEENLHLDGRFYVYFLVCLFVCRAFIVESLFGCKSSWCLS